MNLMGYEWFVKAFSRYRDPEAERIEAAYLDDERRLRAI